jgi:hypothetical protein
MRYPKIATKGHILTDGVEFYTMIYIGEDADETSFWEITREEYDSIIAEQKASTESDVTAEIVEKAQAYDILMGVTE